MVTDRSDSDEDWALDRTSSIPLYIQIRQLLLRRIATWDAPDESFYSDNELCAKLKVSRMTVRQAVQQLVQEGFLRRVRGMGTFVALEKIEERFTPIMNLRDQWASHGRPMSVDVLTFEECPAPPAMAKALDVEPGSAIRYIRRLRSSSQVPIAIDHRYLPLDIAADLTRQGAAGSILHAIGEHHALSHGDLKIEAASATPDEVALLRLLPGDPLLVRHIRYVTADHRPVLAGWTAYRGDLVRYAFQVPLSIGGPMADGEDDFDGTHNVVRLVREVSTS